jgi:hypothetical protein
VPDYPAPVRAFLAGLALMPPADWLAVARRPNAITSREVAYLSHLARALGQQSVLRALGDDVRRIGDRAAWWDAPVPGQTHLEVALAQQLAEWTAGAILLRETLNASVYATLTAPFAAYLTPDSTPEGHDG